MIYSKIIQNKQLLDCKYIEFSFVVVGPKPKTVNDFWRMIFEYRCPTIVMLTTLKEMGKVALEMNNVIHFY